MVELGINLEDQDSSEDTRSSNNENLNNDENKEVSDEENQKLEEEIKDEDLEQSIESVPFISEPVKKKRSSNIK